MALVEEMGVPETGSKRRGDVVLGDDWVAPDGTVTNHDASILTRAYREGWTLPA